MLAIAENILDSIQAAVAPVPADLYRDEEVQIPYVWVRPPSSSRGPKPAQSKYRTGLLYVDIWHYAWVGVDEIETNLAWLDGHREGDFCYHYESDTRIQEPDSCHSTWLFSIYYDDVRGA